MTWGLHTKLYNASKVQDNWLVKLENVKKATDQRNVFVFSQLISIMQLVGQGTEGYQK